MKRAMISIFSILLALLLVACAVPTESEMQRDAGKVAADAEKNAKEGTDAETNETADNEMNADVEADADDAAEEVADAENENEDKILLSDYLKTVDPASMTLEQMYYLSEDLIATGKTIGIGNDTFAEIFIRANSETMKTVVLHEEDDEKGYWLQPTEDEETRANCVYAVFLSAVRELYEEYTVYIDIEYNESYNRLPDFHIMYCPTYRDYGCETMYDFYLAVLEGKCNPPSECYYIGFVDREVFNIYKLENGSSMEGRCLDKWVRE